MIPILSGNVASALPSGYDIDNSCRFNTADNQELTRAIGSTSNRRTGTLSAWVKLCDLTGTGIQDTAIARLALKEAKEKNLGISI